jgi:hypothetical protein
VQSTALGRAAALTGRSDSSSDEPERKFYVGRHYGMFSFSMLYGDANDRCLRSIIWAVFVVKQKYWRSAHANWIRKRTDSSVRTDGVLAIEAKYNMGLWVNAQCRVLCRRVRNVAKGIDLGFNFSTDRIRAALGLRKTDKKILFAFAWQRSWRQCLSWKWILVDVWVGWKTRPFKIENSYVNTVAASVLPLRDFAEPQFPRQGRTHGLPR